jgi:NADH:ubiquinone oxidoreductase subunit E
MSSREPEIEITPTAKSTTAEPASRGRARNPGFAGITGDFDLTEADIRGSAYVGIRPKDGGHAAVAGTLPYQVAERDPQAPIFQGPYAERLEKILSRYEDRQAALLPALAMAQEIRGHLGPEALDEVAAKLGLAPAYVRGVATFYTMYNLAPVGKYLIQVCTNISCNLCGGDKVLEAFLEHTGTDMGMISDNGLWTVIEVECLGACGFPTVVQINERFFENVKPEDVPAILAGLQ